MCIYIYIFTYICVCVLIVWMVAMFTCINFSVGCFRKAESRDVERDPEVRALVLAEQVCMCTLAD